MINIELNITMQCNLACPNCNRLCHIYRDRTEHMSVDQIKRFIEQARMGGGIKKLKILGGEPLLHPQFVEICNLLTTAASEGVIQYIKVETNQTLKIPNINPSKLICFKGRKIQKKKHQPTLWSPQDLGVNSPGIPCMQVSKCGYSLDKYGYLPCSPAIMISRLFGLDLYRYEFPKEVWGLDELCKHCVFSMSPEWRSKYSSRNPTQHTQEECAPTKSYKEAMDKFSNEEFYKTHKEF